MVEFVLVAPMVLVVALAVIQVTVVLHLRSTLTAAAAEGARAAALAGADPRAGERRAREVAAQTLAPEALKGVRVRRTVEDGLDVVVVTLRAAPSVVSLLGDVDVTVDARALVEGWQ